MVEPRTTAELIELAGAMLDPERRPTGTLLPYEDTVRLAAILCSALTQLPLSVAAKHADELYAVANVEASEKNRDQVLHWISLDRRVLAIAQGVSDKMTALFAEDGTRGRWPDL